MTTVQAAGELIINGLPFPAAGNGGSFAVQSYNLTLPGPAQDGIDVAKFGAAGAAQLNGMRMRSDATWQAIGGSVIPINTAIYFRIAGTYRTQ